MNIGAYIKLFKIKHNINYTVLFWVFIVIATAVLFFCGIKSDENLDITAILTVFATLYTCTQIIRMKSISHTEMSNEMYKENRECRQKALTAAENLRELWKLENTITNENFDSVYNRKDFEVLREFAYHYEYLGHMVKKEHIDFSILFDTVTFPDCLINQSENLRKKGREVYPDFWNGVEYLYLTYEVKRKYNKLKQGTGNKK